MTKPKKEEDATEDVTYLRAFIKELRETNRKLNEELHQALACRKQNEGYLLKTEVEPGIIYCEDRDTLISEVGTILDAYEHNGERPEVALRCMQVARLESNHGVLEPANEHLKVVRDDDGYSVE